MSRILLQLLHRQSRSQFSVQQQPLALGLLLNRDTPTCPQPAVACCANQAWYCPPWSLQQRCLFSSLSVQQIERLKREFSKGPRSLQYDDRPPPIPDAMANTTIGQVMQFLMGVGGKKNQLIIGGQVLYDAIREQVDDGALQRAFGMDATVFYTSFTLLSVHVWLVIHRLSHRMARDDKWFKNRFYQHFMNDVEKRVIEAGVQIGVSKWLKKLETVFYSSGLSLDRALRHEGNESVDAVILREFFGNDPSKSLQAELLSQYVLHQLQCLQVTDEEAILEGRIQFSREPFKAFRQGEQGQAGSRGSTGVGQTGHQ